MTGQLNTNLMNSNSEEIQEELDTLSNRLDGVESATSSNTDKINEVDNRVDYLANCVSTDSLNATNVAACNINGSSATITDINANNVTVNNKLKAANIEANNITGNINGNVSANTIDAATANIATANVTEKITAASAEITNVNATNANITNGNISALCTDGITTTGTITSNNVCVKCDINVDGCIIGPKKIATPVNGSVQSGTISGCDVFGSYVHAKDCLRSPEIYGNVEHICQSYIKDACIHNLNVKCSLTLADGITLPNTLGDTTLTKVTTNCLLVNGNTELNGAVKAGSITIGDGSITAGEVCIGAKGIVIDKNKNGAFADITANTVTATKATIPGKITADCIESTDVVSTNTFAKNFYPENITIDKDVGDLHYSRQLDTDAVGGVLVDCKTVTPKEGATGIITKYKDSESNTIKPDSIEYVNEKNGIKVVSCSTADKTSNAITLDTGTTTYGITANEKGLSFKANEDDYALQISKDGDLRIYPRQIIGNIDDPFIAYSKTDGSIYCKYVNILGDACQRSSSGNNYSCKIKEENTWNCCLVTTCYKCTPTACTVGNTTETQTKYTDYFRNYDCITSNSYCFGYQNDNSIEGCSKMVSCRSQGINRFDISLSCCDCTTLAGDTTIYNSCYFETTVYDGSKISCQYIRKNSELPVYSTIKTLGCRSQVLPTTVERHLSNGSCKVCDELAWKVCINNSNLYITNPQRTTSEGCIEDILRVEDGKIYTKCGEFVAGGGGSGGYFEDATFSNGCISGTRSIVNDTITTCVIKTSNVECYSFETSTPNSICFGFGTNECLDDISPIPENNYNKNYFIYTPNPKTSVSCCCCYGPILCTEWSQQFRTICPLYKSNSCYNIVTNEYCYNYKQISPESGNVINCCDIYKSNNCYTCYSSCSEKNSTREICTSSYILERPTDCCCVDTYYWCEANYCTCCCHNIITCNNDHCCERNDTLCCTTKCFTDDAKSIQCYTQSIRTCCLSVTQPSMCITRNQYKDVVEGDATEICLGNYSSNSCNFVYNYSCSCGTLCGCSYEYDSGSYETCYDCYPQYDCNSKYTRFFNGDCICGCKYNATTCQYEAFGVQTCININDKSIDKNVMINNCNISLKEKVTTNQIANLPITNTLVPLAGKVNGNGFAFFCKGADGTKFYDGAFAAVDAGTATDVTYLVTTGV